jgi:hypothetical protein
MIASWMGLYLARDEWTTWPLNSKDCAIFGKEALRSLNVAPKVVDCKVPYEIWSRL